MYSGGCPEYAPGHYVLPWCSVVSAEIVNSPVNAYIYRQQYVNSAVTACKSRYMYGIPAESHNHVCLCGHMHHRAKAH